MPLQPTEVHGGEEIHLQPLKDPTHRWMPRGGCDLMGSLPWNRPLAGPVNSWAEEPTWSRFAGRTCDPVGDPC